MDKEKMIELIRVWLNAFFGSGKESIELQFVKEENPNWVIFFIERKRGKEQLSVFKTLSSTKVPLNEFLDSLRGDNKLLLEVYSNLKDKTGWNHVSARPAFISAGIQVFKIKISETAVSSGSSRVLISAAAQ